MDWIGPAIDAIAGIVKAIEVVAPPIAMAITGGRSVDDWKKTAHEAHVKLKNREESGDWDADLTEREKNG